MTGVQTCALPIYEDSTGNSWAYNSNIDLPQGGYSYIIGNILHQGPSHGRFMLSYAKENQNNPGRKCFIINNTFFNDGQECTFLHCPPEGYEVTFANNIFIGSVGLTTGNAEWKDMNNLVTADRNCLRDPDKFDYRLSDKAEAAVDKGINPGTHENFSLMPVKQYVHKCRFEDRGVKGSAPDIGAYECD